MTFETLGVTGITGLEIYTGSHIVNPGIFRVAIKGGPIPSLEGIQKAHLGKGPLEW